MCHMDIWTYGYLDTISVESFFDLLPSSMYVFRYTLRVFRVSNDVKCGEVFGVRGNEKVPGTSLYIYYKIP